MEGLGIAANVIAVVDLAAKACGAIYSYVKSAKGCTKTVLQLQTDLTAVQTTLDGLQKIADRLDTAARPLGLGVHGTPSVLSELSTELNECKTTLGKLLEDLEGHFRNKLRSKIGRQLKWPLKEPDVMEYISRLGKYQQTFQSALQIDIASLTLEIKTDVHVVKTDVREVKAEVREVKTGVREVKTDIREVTTEVQRVHSEQLRDIHERVARTDQEKLDQLVKWLSPLHYNVKHEESVEKHQEDTGTWLFENKIYQEWEKSTQSVLWIHGIPGCGKTILASSIIDRIEDKFCKGSECGFAYFYCQYNREETKDPSNIIRTLLAQLLYGLNYSTVEKAAGPLFAKMAKGHGPPIDCKHLAQHVTSAVELYTRSVIVIDGLDECTVRLRGMLLDFITTLKSTSSISILVLSRKEVDIEDELKDFPTISLDDEQINLKEDMRKLIIEEFRWLQCQLDLLNRLPTQKAIKEALGRLPRTLFETYDRMLEYIEEDSVELACKAFQLIVHSERPLTIEELVEALAVNNNDTRLDLSATFSDPRDLYRICSSLVYDGKTSGYPWWAPSLSEDESLSKDESYQSVRLCHYTVQEYLVSDYLRTHPTLSHYAIAKKGTNEAHSSLAKWTLRYLLLDDFSEPCASESQIQERHKQYKFYPYCSLYWLYHTHKVELEDDDLFELVDSFVFSSPNHLRSYEQMMKVVYYNPPRVGEQSRINLESQRFVYRHEHDDDEKLSDALFYHIIKEDLNWIIQRILRNRPEWLDRDVREIGPPLRIAAVAGNQDMVEFLLTLGADLNKEFPSHESFTVTPFWRDENKRYYDILLKYDPAPGHWPSPFRVAQSLVPPLHILSQYVPDSLPFVLGYADTIDVNVRAKDGSTPIHCAVLGDSLEAVKTLVAAGADIHAKTYARRTCFHIAVTLQSNAILEYLLDQNVAIPLDMTDKLLDWVAEDVRRKIKLPEVQQGAGAQAGPHPDWIRTVASTQKSLSIPRKHDPTMPLVSIVMNGNSLKRIVFKIDSNDYHMFSPTSLTHQRSGKITSRNPYMGSFGWYHVVVANASHHNSRNNERTKTSTSQCEEYSCSDIAPRHIETNIAWDKDSYHMVMWDVRDPTPGVREWLEAIHTGDVINVHVRVRGVFRIYVNSVEVEIFCEH
ncbi:hypothetical protein BDD12DRAFT_924175 [Trichophaea hybrida]|nr:hypothetical protein BDD12DRAFT_924175 [Trichophaea hybrida]